MLHGGGRFAGESELTQGFVEDQGDAVREVQGSRLGIEHGDPQPAIGILVQEVLRQTGGFPPKYQVIVGEKFDIRVAPDSARLPG